MKKIIDSVEFKKILEQLCSKFVGEHKSSLEKDPESLCIVGIQTRGVYVAERLSELLKKKYKISSQVGSLDITLYRDDVGEIGNQPLVKESNIPFEIEGKTILLVDDVLYTGRTIRAALDALLELGRPKFIRLAVVVDREGRELPVQADFSGVKMKVGISEDVQLKVREVDHEDGVWLNKK